MSQLDAHRKRIDGVEYEVRMLPATRATKLLVKLGKMLGPAFAAIARGEGGIDREIDGALFAGAVSALFASADPDEVDAILKELAEVTLADGKGLRPIYDIHFAGKIGRLMKWAAFALQVQYEDFFGALGSVLAEAGLSSAMESLSPKASIGASGA